ALVPRDGHAAGSNSRPGPEATRGSTHRARKGSHLQIVTILVSLLRTEGSIGRGHAVGPSIGFFHEVGRVDHPRVGLRLKINVPHPLAPFSQARRGVQ